MKIQVSDEGRQVAQEVMDALRSLGITALSKALDVPTKHDRMVLSEIANIISKAEYEIGQILKAVSGGG